MSRLAVSRVRHVKQSISTIRELLDGHSLEDARQSKAIWLAFERSLEILSEASRHVPDDWKAEFATDVPWRQIADLGNALRHIYHEIDAAALWSIYKDDLDPLEAAIDRMLAAKDKPPA